MLSQEAQPSIRKWGGVILAGLLLSLPTLWNGFSMDDYAQTAMIEGWYPERANTFNLYEGLTDYILFPWWSSPDLEITFWRPLSSALIRLDHSLFGRFALAGHIHSLLWYCALLTVAASIYSRFSSRVAMPALAIFAIDECHGFPVGWIANRHALVSLTLGLLGLCLHLRWRQDGWRPGLPLSIAAFAIGLAAGETALSAMAYALAFELFGRAEKGSKLLRSCWIGLIPMTALALGYLMAYRSWGYGTYGSGTYLDPIGEPLGYLVGISTRIPAYLSAALLAFPSGLWLRPELRAWQVGLCVVAMLFLALFGARRWKHLGPDSQRAVRWIGVGILGSLLPVAAAVPFDQYLIAPMFGLALLLGAVFDSLRQTWRIQTGKRWSWRSLTAGAGLTLLVLVHGIVGPLGRLASQHAIRQVDHGLREVASQLPDKTLHAVLINAPDFFTMSYVPVVYDYMHSPGFLTWSVLAQCPRSLRLRRTGPRSLEVEVVDGELFNTFGEQMFRPPDRALKTGDVVDHSIFRAEVLVTGLHGVTRLAFHFRDDLDREDLVFYSWGRAGLETVRPPEPGQLLELDPPAPPPVPGP